MLHRIWQVHHIPPDEMYKKEWRHKQFIYASEELAIEAEIKARKEAESN